MALKIKADTLHDFIVKATAKGLVADCKLVFDELGLRMQHKDSPGMVYIDAFLDKTAFVDYEAMTLEVKSTDVLLKALVQFGDNVIQLARTETMARVFSDTMGFDLALAENVVCHKVVDTSKLVYDHNIIVRSSMAKQLVEMAKVVKSDEVFVQNAGKELIYHLGKASDKASVKSPTLIDANYVTTFDLTYFTKLTANMAPMVEFSIGCERPSKWTEKTDKLVITYLLTPVIPAA